MAHMKTTNPELPPSYLKLNNSMIYQFIDTPRHYSMDVYWTVSYQSGSLLSFVHCCWVNSHHLSVFVKLFYKFLKKRRKKYHVFENSMENGAFALLEKMLHFP